MVGNIVAFSTPICLRLAWGSASQLLELNACRLARGPCRLQALEIVLPISVLVGGEVEKIVPAIQAAIVAVVEVQFEGVVTGLGNVL